MQICSSPFRESLYHYHALPRRIRRTYNVGPGQRDVGLQTLRGRRDVRLLHSNGSEALGQRRDDLVWLSVVAPPDKPDGVTDAVVHTGRVERADRCLAGHALRARRHPVPQLVNIRPGQGHARLYTQNTD